MPPPVATWHKLVARQYKIFKHGWKQLQANLQSSARAAQAELEPIPIRVKSQPLHPAAYLRQSQSRWFSTERGIKSAVRHFSRNAASGPSGVKYDRSSFPSSRIGTLVNQSPGRAPFASTLRPNITGGTLNRTAGGYSLGSGRIGGARYFSHSPAAPAEVIQNVSQAVRTFYSGGKKAQYTGVNPQTGRKKYKTVSALQDETFRKVRSVPKASPGSYVDFQVNPTITALTPLQSVAGFSANAHSESANATLHSEGLLDVLSIDFSRTLKDLSAVLNDLKRLSDLGDLPITYQGSGALRVQFPGCDAETVERLCEELGVARGVVAQDPDFDVFAGTEIALLFPFAPSEAVSETESVVNAQEAIDWHNMVQDEAEKYSTQSEMSRQSQFEILTMSQDFSNPWASDSASLEGYSSLSSPKSSRRAPTASDPLEYQGFEGIYRFIEMCNEAQR